jgi:ABC-type transport system involved in cytochrome c biogenesis, permease component
MNRYEKAALGAVALMLLAAGAIFLFAPTDALQGPVQRIFYLHVSSAIAAYGCFAVVLLGGAIYLRNGSLAADRLARAGALVGLVFTTVTLVMGMLWAKPIWGTFWTWDARLTSTLVLWIIYAGYLLVRRLAEPGRQAARFPRSSASSVSSTCRSCTSASPGGAPSTPGRSSSTTRSRRRCLRRSSSRWPARWPWRL